jgi:hypothetical protein
MECDKEDDPIFSFLHLSCGLGHQEASGHWYRMSCPKQSPVLGRNSQAGLRGVLKLFQEWGQGEKGERWEVNSTMIYCKNFCKSTPSTLKKRKKRNIL